MPGPRGPAFNKQPRGFNVTGLTREFRDFSLVIGCKSFRYVKDVTTDSPSGYMFSHISQADAHFRMNFSGYEK